MTLTQFVTLITTKWGDITSPKRTPESDRDVANGIKGELWPTTVLEVSAGTHANTEIAGGLSLNYFLKFKKSGNTMFVMGYITNNSASPITPQTLITITNSEWTGLSGLSSSSIRVDGINVSINGNNIAIGSALAANTSLTINGFYTTVNG